MSEFGGGEGACVVETDVESGDEYWSECGGGVSRAESSGFRLQDGDRQQGGTGDKLLAEIAEGFQTVRRRSGNGNVSDERRGDSHADEYC